MKNLAAIVALLAFGIMSCSGCAKKNQVVPPPTPSVLPPVVPSSAVLSNGNLQVTVPNSDWQMLETDAETTFKGFLNPGIKNLIVLNNEPSTASFDEYVLITLRNMKETGTKVVSSKQVTIAGQKFVRIEALVVDNDVQVFVLVSTDNGHGYMVACGSPAELQSQSLCDGVLGSVKLMK